MAKKKEDPKPQSEEEKEREEEVELVPVFLPNGCIRSYEPRVVR